MAWTGPFGNVTVPSPSDVMGSAGAAVGNVVEGVIEAVTGDQVELTPGQGVDNTTIAGPGGSTTARFGHKFASHDDVEHLRKQTQDQLNRLTREVRLLRAQVRSNGNPYTNSLPGGTTSMWFGGGTPQYNSGMDPTSMMLMMMMMGTGTEMSSMLPLLLLSGGGGNMNIGNVGGAPMSVSLFQLMMVQMMLNLLSPNSKVTAGTANPA